MTKRIGVYVFLLPSAYRAVRDLAGEQTCSMHRQVEEMVMEWLIEHRHELDEGDLQAYHLGIYRDWEKVMG